MNFVLTNDDGIDAPGLQALKAALGGQGVIVAPDGPLSGCSHRVTTHEGPIRVERRDGENFSVHGTPADCARLAFSHLCREATILVAGINPGGNLGVDIYLSGTVAAAREAAFLGYPGIAVSQYIRRGLSLDWETTIRYAMKVLEDLLEREHDPGTYWNVNLPHLAPGEADPEIVFCEPCTRPLPVAYRVEGEDYHYEGVYSDRAKDPGADVELCFSGKITVSLLRL